MNCFLIPHEDGTWDVRKEGANRDSYSGLSSLSTAKNAARGLGGVRVAVKGLDEKLNTGKICNTWLSSQKKQIYFTSRALFCGLKLLPINHA